jgi:hypothetical protein
MLQRAGNAGGKIAPIAQEGHEGIDHELRTARHPSLKDYKARRRAFLAELIASTPNVSARAKEFRRWIDENSPRGDNDEG